MYIEIKGHLLTNVDMTISEKKQVAIVTKENDYSLSKAKS